MSAFFSRIVLVVGSTLLAFAYPVAAQDTKADGKAKEIYGQFLKATKAKDLDAMMKLVDVPWLGFSKEVIKDEKVLRTTLKQVLSFDPEPKSDVKEVLSYSQFREKFKDKIVEKKGLLKQLDELNLTKDDRVIVESTAVIFVRIREGKTKIVGVLQ